MVAGRPRAKIERMPMAVRLPRVTIEMIDAVALSQKRSRAQMTSIIIDEWFQNREKEINAARPGR